MIDFIVSLVIVVVACIYFASIIIFIGVTAASASAGVSPDRLIKQMFEKKPTEEELAAAKAETNAANTLLVKHDLIYSAEMDRCENKEHTKFFAGGPKEYYRYFNSLGRIYAHLGMTE